MRVMPGDALTALMGESGNIGERELAHIRQQLRLDLPYYEQYAIWIWQMVSLSPGDSIFTGEAITVSLAKAIPVTLELTILALILGLVIAVLIPVVTIVGGQLGVLLAGTVVVESIFALPGMGRLTVEAILYRDYPVVQTNVMLVAGTLVTLNLLVDLSYAWLDPRIRYR